MNKTNLYLIAALIWGIPGIIISVKGIRAYLSMAPENIFLADFSASGMGPGPLYDMPRDRSEIHPRHSRGIHRVILQRTGPYAGRRCITFYP